MNKYSFKVLDQLNLDIQITSNPYQIPLQDLFAMAARINKKRSFLFVSKILGKHIPVDPHIGLLGAFTLGLLLHAKNEVTMSVEMDQIVRGFSDSSEAFKLCERLKQQRLPVPEPMIFIGFAETATALGHGMFDLFTGPARFIHTTRESIHDTSPRLSFEEEHSHATAHRCYAADPDFFSGEDTVVLVDDEITTGKTALNIIQDIQQKHPRKHYVLASLLDWRSDEQKEQFTQVEQSLGITIDCISLVQGKISVNGAPPEVQAELPDLPVHDAAEQHIGIISLSEYFDHLSYSSTNSVGDVNKEPFLKFTGRFGMNAQESYVLDASISKASAYLKQHRTGKKTLCLGTGEFMYIPMRIAAEMGDGIYYQSSTRSPIHPSDHKDYAVRNKFPFHSPDDPAIPYYFYNVPEGVYEEVFVFMERPHQPETFQSYEKALLSTGIPQINVVFC
ncbi:phosphoribosyltransferase family protein [Paenibacillus sp. P96]|uniref:Phosphoribosyltransferase family protein n=1 Tax=Paenibacillus zeirhizosphaerae TaxID=2987519 RepID=A0ABT9FTM1_9BACL|nr:phosphoribosyltransferase family protein [Paenibacillus sp. P96]MDP4098055.1 phosphoribosyltransferase family protein [Paenibacillus sp. P96]